VIEPKEVWAWFIKRLKWNKKKSKRI